MTTNLLSLPSAGRALGIALASALALSVVPARAVSLVTASAAIPNQVGGDATSGYFPVGSPFKTENNPNLASFDFSSTAYGSLDGTISVVGVSLALYNFDTDSAGIDFNNITLILKGTNTTTSVVETVNTGVLLNGFDNDYTAGSFNFTASTGASILTLLNDTGGLITASILDATTPSGVGAAHGTTNNFWFGGGSMVLTFAVPFSPVEWLGLAVIGLLAAIRLTYVGSMKRLRDMAGV